MDRTDPSLRAFSNWINRVLAEFKADRKWGITRLAQESKTPRSALTRWRDADWTSGVPTRESVRRFCESLGLEVDVPFGFFGWDPSGPSTSPERVTEPILPDLRVRKLQALLRDPDLMEFEREKYEAFMDMLIADAEAVLEDRRKGDSDPDSQTGRLHAVSERMTDK